MDSSPIAKTHIYSAVKKVNPTALNKLKNLKRLNKAQQMNILIVKYGLMDAILVRSTKMEWICLAPEKDVLKSRKRRPIVWRR